MGTVFVACKLVNGVRIAAGNKSAVIPGPKPFPQEMIESYTRARRPLPVRPGGYEITAGVDVDLWNGWSAANADSDLVSKRLIFAAETFALVQALARTNGRNNPSGFEPASRN